MSVSSTGESGALAYASAPGKFITSTNSSTLKNQLAHSDDLGELRCFGFCCRSVSFERCFDNTPNFLPIWQLGLINVFDFLSKMAFGLALGIIHGSLCAR